MSDPAFDEHRDRITRVAHEALDTNIAHLLAEYRALLTLVARVAGPGARARPGTGRRAARG